MMFHWYGWYGHSGSCILPLQLASTLGTLSCLCIIGEGNWLRQERMETCRPSFHRAWSGEGLGAWYPERPPQINIRVALGCLVPE